METLGLIPRGEEVADACTGQDLRDAQLRFAPREWVHLIYRAKSLAVFLSNRWQPMHLGNNHLWTRALSIQTKVCLVLAFARQ